MSLHLERDELGYYTWDDVRYPSVTTILGILGSGFLMNWYAKMAARECAGYVHHRNQVIGGILMDMRRELEEAGGTVDERTLEIRKRHAMRKTQAEADCDTALLNWEMRMRAAVTYRDFKANIGSLTHRAFYDRVSGEYDMVNVPVDYLMGLTTKLNLIDNPDADQQLKDVEHLAKSAQPYVHWLFKWLDEKRPSIDAVGLEAVVVSQKHGYAGRKDLRARMDGKRGLGDLKTSNQMDFIKWQSQLEAYRHADFIGTLHDGKQYEIGHLDGTFTIWIHPDRPVTVRWWDEANAEAHWQMFLAAKNLYVAHEAVRSISRRGGKGNGEDTGDSADLDAGAE